MYNMPPILLLTGNDKFYGKLKPTAGGDSQSLKLPAPPPNPMSNVRLTNDLQRDNAVERITADINNPSDLKSSENPSLQAELVVKDTEKLKNSNDLGARFTQFLQGPIVATTKEADLQQNKREVQRIGLTNDNLEENIVRPIGEVPVAVAKEGVDIVGRGFDFLENKALSFVMILGGIYVVSQFASGFGRSVGSTKKKIPAE